MKTIKRILLMGSPSDSISIFLPFLQNIPALCEEGNIPRKTKTLEHSLCDNFKPRQSPAFVLDHINVAFGIHSGTNCIEDLTVEEETSAVTESPEKFSCLTIEYINFPLVLIHDVHKPLIRVARKFDRNG